MIVTIDGPAGAGKSTAARGLAQALDFEFLDTGAMYRAVTLACLRSGIDVRNRARVAELLPSLELLLDRGIVTLNGEDVTTAIRKSEVTSASGEIASNPQVRHHLVEQQRKLANGRNMVCEGRDQGTIVFPDAICKFFLTASPEERAGRRFRELLARGEVVTLLEVLNAQLERDRRDALRDIAPMAPAQDALILDSSCMTHEEVVLFMERTVRERLSQATNC